MKDFESSSEPLDPIVELLREAGPREPMPVVDLDHLSAPALDAWQRQLDQRRRMRVAMAAAVACLVAGLGWFWSLRSAPVATVIAYAGADSGVWSVGTELSRGTMLETSQDPGQWLTLETSGGHRLRLDAGTRLSLTSPSQIDLLAGGVYVEAAPAPLRVHAGDSVVEHVGTRYEARLSAGRLKVRAREGRVILQRGRQSVAVDQGFEASWGEDGEAVLRAAPAHGDSWRWTRQALPAFNFDGAELRSFLLWIEAELGRSVEIDDSLLVDGAGRPVILRGPGLANPSASGLSSSTTELSLIRALDLVLESAGLRSWQQGERIVITVWDEQPPELEDSP